MKIVHICQFKLDHSNGVQAAAWILACEQAKAGEEVAVLTAVGAAVATIGGGWFGLTSILFIGIFRSRLHELEIEESQAIEENREINPSSRFSNGSL